MLNFIRQKQMKGVFGKYFDLLDFWWHWQEGATGIPGSCWGLSGVVVEAVAPHLKVWVLEPPVSTIWWER